MGKHMIPVSICASLAYILHLFACIYGHVFFSWHTFDELESAKNNIFWITLAYFATIQQYCVIYIWAIFIEFVFSKRANFDNSKP